MSKGMLGVLVVCAVLFTGAAEQSPHGPIVIRSDDDFTAERGVVSGKGLPGDPYVIEGWCIDADGEDHGVLIHNTTRTFVIRNVSIRGARLAGIRISQARDGRVQDVHIAGCTTGVYIHNSARLTFRDVTIEQCVDGIRMLFSSQIELGRARVENCQVGLWTYQVTGLVMQDSTLSSCNVGVLLEHGSEGNILAGNAFLNCLIPAQSQGGNQFHMDSRGNYWEDHSAPDEDDDGILDTPYPVQGGEDEDPFPLASLP